MHQLNLDSMDVTRTDLPLVVAHPSTSPVSASRELGGDLVTRPSEDQQQAITEIGTAGYSS